MDRLECSPYLHDTLQSLATHSRIELYLLLNRAHYVNRLERAGRKLRTVGLARFVSLAAFKMLVAVEGRIVRVVAPATRSHFREIRIDESIFTASVTVDSVFSRNGTRVSYRDDDVQKIQALRLDLILRGNGSGIYRGGILHAAKHGIISFHHGDNRWNRGGPPGFWEVWYRKAATGFVVQILNERLDAGDVIFRAEVPTKRCYTESLINLYRASNPFMASIIAAYADSGSLPAPLPAAPFAHHLLRTPPLSVTAGYAARMTRTFASLAVRRKVLRVRERWSVAFIAVPWQDADLGKATVITNPHDRFLADPFVVSRDGETVIFVEDFHYASRRGSISAVRVLPDGSYDLVPDVVKEPFHLSFPYVFAHAGELFMIPESHQSKSIRLYRCARFPDRWEYQHDLISGVAAVDTIVFELQERWWLLTSIAPGDSGEFDALLYAFAADSPCSTAWAPHPCNPVRASVEYGRNAGILRGKDGSLFRVRQKQGFNRYGQASSIARIVRLDAEGYEEQQYCTVEAAFWRGIAGTHHMHCNGDITVFDFVREEAARRPPARRRTPHRSSRIDSGRT